MRREEMEELLVGYLYGELGAEERERVEREIDRDPQWSEVLEDLRRTDGILRRWEEEEPGLRHLVAAPREEALPRRPGRPRWRAAVPAVVGVAAALLLVAMRAEVRVEDGRFELSFGREPAPVPSPAPTRAAGLETERGPFVTEDDFLRSQAELVRFVAALMDESESRQNERFITTLAEYARAAETRREGDLVFMDRRLGVVEEGARDLLDRVGAEFPISNVRPPSEVNR
jgi:hypothetical protein